jgi:ATP/maltotriose-dependent transcriptional regulator MalT
MYGTLVRVTLIAFGLVAGVAFVQRGLLAGWLFLLMALLLVIGWWRNGRLGPAWRAYVKGDLAEVERRLERIARPDRLGPQQLAYYHFLRGVLARSRSQLAEACAEFERALQGLRTPRDRAFTEAHLAEVALVEGDLPTARAYLDRAGSTRTSKGVSQLLQALHQRLAAAEARGGAGPHSDPHPNPRE